jgi:hypothetical protein
LHNIFSIVDYLSSTFWPPTTYFSFPVILNFILHMRPNSFQNMTFLRISQDITPLCFLFWNLLHLCSISSGDFFFLMKSPRWTFSFSRTNPKWLSGESSTLREISYCFHLLTRILRRFCACRNEFLKAPGSSPSCCCWNLIVSRTSFSSKWKRLRVIFPGARSSSAKHKVQVLLSNSGRPGENGP